MTTEVEEASQAAENQAAADEAAAAEASFSRTMGGEPPVEKQPEPAKTPEGVKPQEKEPIQQAKVQGDGFDPRLEQRLKSLEGRIGKVLNFVDQATKATQASGAATPTQTQIAAATQDPKKWNELKKDFQEWGDAIDERLAIERESILKSIPKVDLDGIRREFAESSQASASELRQKIALDLAHEEWEETIKRPEFVEFAYSGGPTADEQSAFLNMRDGVRNELGQFDAPPQPEKADQFFNSFALKYPQWWAERGAFLASPHAKDAKKLLDKYVEHTNQTQVNAEAAAQAAEAKKRNESRLEAAVQPQGVPRGTRPESMTEEEAAAASFRKVRGG